MITTVYISRHSKPMKPIFKLSNDNLQLQNEKQLLTPEGERRAKILSEMDELKDIDVVISSNYVRTMSTAKYIADKNNIDLIIIDDFGERKFGINSLNELPKNFEEKQLEEENYKMPNGESKKEVTQRMLNALNNVLDEYRGKRIAIVSHATAMNFLFMAWCEIKSDTEDECSRYFYFNDKEFFNGKYDAPELFKLEFEDKKLTNIENMRVNYE